LRIALVLAAVASATGCSSLVLSESEAGPETDPSRGEVRLKAPRRGSSDQARGYAFLLRAPDGSLVAETPSGGGPWAFEDLPPGKYEVRISGRKIRSFSVDVKVKPGRRSTLTFYAWRERASGAAEDVAIVTGKTLFYTVLGVIYIPWLCVQETLLDIDDDDDEDDPVRVYAGARNDNTRRKDKPEEPEKHEGTPRPRVRSLLKDP